MMMTVRKVAAAMVHDDGDECHQGLGAPVHIRTWPARPELLGRTPNFLQELFREP
jgi:hypothetical protein